MKDNLMDFLSLILFVGILLLILNAAITYKRITDLENQLDQIHSDLMEEKVSTSDRFRSINTRLGDVEKEIKLIFEEE